MKSKRQSHIPAPLPSPAASAASGQVSQPYGNAALAEGLAAQAASSQGEEVAMHRGQAAGLMAGMGIAAANAFGSGGLPALLNPDGYWGTYNEPPAPALVQPGGAMIRKVD